MIFYFNCVCYINFNGTFPNRFRMYWDTINCVNNHFSQRIRFFISRAFTSNLRALHEHIYTNMYQKHKILMKIQLFGCKNLFFIYCSKMIRDTFQTFYECRSHILRPSTVFKCMVVNDDTQRIGHRMMVSGVEIYFFYPLQRFIECSHMMFTLIPLTMFPNYFFPE